MPTGVTFKEFEAKLNLLVAKFEKNIQQYKGPGYDEASLRLEFLDPLFRALGWDMENQQGLIYQHREVEIESRTRIGGRQKRADYLFRADKRDRFVCEAKKPAEELNARYAFQAKRYAWNKDLPLAVLSDFEEIKIYIVGGKPFLDQPDAGLWKSWHFKQFPLIAGELWNLLARENVAAGSIDKLLESLPKKPAGKGKLRQQWLIKPDRSRALDTDFLEFLDETRRDLASDLIRHNDRSDLLEGNKLNEAVQIILDRILFLRICEDRDIDTGALLSSLVDLWRKNYGKEEGLKAKQQPLHLISVAEPPPPAYEAGAITAPRDSLWFSVVSHFRALDRRPPSHVPFFNGNLFKPHFSETLIVSDEWLAGFIGELSNDESPYLFSAIRVEILGSIYERFLGKVVRPHGKGVVIEEKPEVRKAGGVYYTPSYIVNYIVEQTVGKLLDDICSGGLRPPDKAKTDRRSETAATESSASSSGRRRREEADSSSSLGAPPREEADSSSTVASATRLVTSAPTIKDFTSRTNALRFLDPACGSGSFLIRAFERVCEHWQQWLTANPGQQKKQWCWVDPETKDVHLTVALKREILRNNIYGVDLDSGAVEVTQLSLYLKMLENENRTTLARERDLFPEEVALLPPLQDNIKCGNSLIASDFSMIPEDLVRVHAFDWPIQFEKIMKNGGFDAVVGNPPYRMLQPHNTEEQELEYLKANYVAAEFKIELFHLFLQRGISLLKTHGLHGHIVPTTLLNNVYAESLRRWIMERCSIQRISVAKGQVFEDADVHTSVLIFKSEPDTKTRAQNEVLTNSSLCAEFAAAPSGFSRTKQLRFAEMPGAIWNILLNEENAPLFQKLNGKCLPLEKVSKINRGLITGDREKYFSPKKLSAKHHPILAGADVHRYATNRPSEFVLFERPKTSGGCWDSEVHLAPHKILIRQIGLGPTASLITEPIAVTGNIFTVRADLVTKEKYLLAVINSKLTAYFWRTMFADFKTSFPQVTIFSLSQVPIRDIDLSDSADKTRHDKLVNLVEKMLGLMPKLRGAKTESEKTTLENAVKATDQRIDALVYELYGLTAEEIALVEAKP